MAKSKCCNSEILEVGFRKAFEGQTYKCSNCNKQIEKPSNVLKYLGIFALFLLSLLLLSNFTSALNVDFVSPTPSNGSTVNTRSFIINATIDSDNPLSSIIYNWNGTNYSIYDDSLVLYYNFDNRSALGENSTHVKDISRYGNNGTTNATINISGKYDGAFTFNGNNSFVQISNSNSLNGSNGLSSFTLSFWINIFSNTSATTRIINKGDVDAGTPLSGWEIEMSNAGTLGFLINNQSGSTNVNSTTIIYEKNKWIHITYIYNGTHIYAYKDGVLTSTIKKVNFNNFVVNDNIFIGRRSSANTQNFNGSIDELRYYADKALNNSEVYLLYNSAITKFNNSRYLIYNNQTNLSIFNTFYSIFTNDSSNNQNSSQKIIRLLNNLNFTTNQNFTINSMFYGTNTHGIWGSNLSFVEINGVRIASNYSFHREKLNNVFMKSLRADMALADSSINETTFNTTANQSNYVNIQTRRDQVDYARSTGKRITFIADQAQKWNRNVSNSCNGDNSTCPPLNYTAYANNVVNFLSAVGCDENVCDVEVYNEPYDKLLSNESRSSPNISLVYNQIYNATYTRIKQVYPNMKVGANVLYFGFGSSNITYYNYTNFISTFQNKFDYLESHIYWDNLIYDQMTSQLIDIKSVCNTYSQSCSDIRIGELNSYNASLSNDTAFYNQNFNILTQGFIFGILNNISSLQLYQWSEVYNYNNTAFFGDYPNLYSSLSEPIVDNSYYAGFNSTYLNSRYLANSAITYNVLVDCNEIITLASEKSSKKSFVILNKINDYQNTTLNCASFTGNLMDISSGQIYSCSSGSVNLGITSPYGVRYLTEPIAQNGIYYNYLMEPLGYYDEPLANNIQTRQEFCGDGATGIAEIFSKIPISMVILGIIFIMGFILLIVHQLGLINENKVDLGNAMELLSETNIPIIIVTLSTLVFFSIVVVMAIGFICSIT